MSPIRVLIVDDQALMRGALATLLGLKSDLKAVAQMRRSDEVLDAVRKHAMDVALVDIDMPGRDGLAVTAKVVDSDLPCRYPIVTTFGRPSYLPRGIEAEAAGFIVKDTPPETLAETIRKVHMGLRAINPELAQESVLLGPSPFTEREKEVLLVAATDVDTREIATRLSPGESTVCNYLSSAIVKIRARSRTEAARTAETND